ADGLDRGQPGIARGGRDQPGQAAKDDRQRLLPQAEPRAAPDAGGQPEEEVRRTDIASAPARRERRPPSPHTTPSSPRPAAAAMTTSGFTLVCTRSTVAAAVSR